MRGVAAPHPQAPDRAAHARPDAIELVQRAVWGVGAPGEQRGRPDAVRPVGGGERAALAGGPPPGPSPPGGWPPRAICLPSTPPSPPPPGPPPPVTAAPRAT